MKKILFLLMVVGLGLFATSCKKTTEPVKPQVKQGFIISMERLTLYTELNKLSDIKTIKAKVKRGEEVIELPSISFNGSDDSISSEPCFLEVGSYELISYKAYDARAIQIYETEVDKDNKFEVKAGEITSFRLPLRIKTVMDQNIMKSILIGICREVIGDDKSQWPWVIEDDLAEWKYLEWEYDSGNVYPVYPTGITFSGRYFSKMTKLPDAVAGMASFLSITLDSLPNLTALTETVADLRCNTFTIYDCPKLVEFPMVLCKLKTLNSLTINRCGITAVPDEIGNLEGLRALEFVGNAITQVSPKATKGEFMHSFNISDNPIAALELEVPTNSDLLVINVNNTKLSTLPESLLNAPKLSSVFAMGCQFTEIPKVVRNHTNISGAHFADNKIGTVKSEDFASNSGLLIVDLSGNPLTGAVELAIPSLEELSLCNASLTTMPKIVGLPSLRLLNLKDNKITSVPENYFEAAQNIGALILDGNTTLSSLPASWGFALNGGVPSKFRNLSVNGCSALTYKIPASWCCIDTEQLGEEFLIYDKVVVYNEGAPGVTWPEGHQH